MKREEIKKLNYKYVENDIKLNNIVDIIDDAVKLGLLKLSFVYKDKNENYNYTYNFVDSENNIIKKYKINIIIPKKLYSIYNIEIKQLNIYIKNKISYINQKLIIALTFLKLIASPSYMTWNNSSSVVAEDEIIELDNYYNTLQDNNNFYNFNNSLNDKGDYINIEDNYSSVEDELNRILNK